MLLIWMRGNTRRIKRDPKSPNTPPSLLGIDRKIAYANRKYHSGTMWGGVTIGFAAM